MPAETASMTSSTAEALPLPATYDDAVAELERLIGSMESAQLPLEQLLDRYRRGARLLSFCRDRLEALQEQVRVFEDGQMREWNGAAP